MRNIFFAKENLPELTASQWLIETIERSMKIGFSSEKSRSERLVSTILTELSIQNNESFTIYSSMFINADELRGLNGECDFMLSFSKIQDFVMSPIINITEEAKKQDIESGSIQCAAQLIAADIINKQDNYNFTTLFGCATTGTEWRFIKLEDKKLTLDIDRYFISNLNELLSIWQLIMNKAISEVNPV